MQNVFVFQTCCARNVAEKPRARKRRFAGIFILIFIVILISPFGD